MAPVTDLRSRPSNASAPSRLGRAQELCCRETAQRIPHGRERCSMRAVPDHDGLPLVEEVSVELRVGCDRRAQAHVPPVHGPGNRPLAFE